MKPRMSPVEFRRVRQLYGMTQAEWATALGLDGAWAGRTIRKYEAGKAPIVGPVRRCAELLREKKEGTP